MPDRSASAAVAPTVITPAAQVRLWAEVWAYRELLYFLVWRDLKVRYKQTVLGVLWALAQPLTAMVIFSVVFGRLASMPSDGVPYPAFAYAALVPWTYAAAAVSGGAQSLVGSQTLIAKVYFPRLIIPFAAVLVPLVDAAVALAVLGLLMAWYGLVPGAAVVTLPVWAALAVATGTAASLWLSALNAKYRDVRYVVPFLTQVWLFATPVAYPTSLVPERWRDLAGLNPMATVVDGFRWALVGAPAPSAAMLVVSVVVVLAVWGSGLRYFARGERTLADVI
jgi:lipopolysaccharide transport system permease protein